MAFKDLFKKKKRDPMDLKGLEAFSPVQRERILNQLGNKQNEILERQANLEMIRRSNLLDRDAGFGNPEKQRKGMMARFDEVKEFRHKNIERRKNNIQRQEEKEKDFREGKLLVKPIGPERKDPKRVGKLVVKQIKLKSPDSLL